MYYETKINYEKLREACVQHVQEIDFTCISITPECVSPTINILWMPLWMWNQPANFNYTHNVGLEIILIIMKTHFVNKF